MSGSCQLRLYFRVGMVVRCPFLFDFYTYQFLNIILKPDCSPDWRARLCTIYPRVSAGKTVQYTLARKCTCWGYFDLHMALATPSWVTYWNCSGPSMVLELFGQGCIFGICNAMILEVVSRLGGFQSFLL